MARKSKKDPARVKAGKKAWAKLSASAKAARISALKRFSKKSGSSSSSSHSNRGTNMAKGKSNGKGKRQGIASWASSIMALVIGFSSDIARIGEAMYAPKGQRLARFAELEFEDYLGYYPSFTGLDGPPAFNPKSLIRGWGSKAAGIGFKKASSYLTKTAKVQSIIPRLGLR